jgi:hypothetical protein
VALAGFAIDSLIEIFASVVVVWHLNGTGRQREKPALLAIGAAFLALSLYIIVQTVYLLVVGGSPAPSTLGMTWLAMTVLASFFSLGAKASPDGNSATLF